MKNPLRPLVLLIVSACLAAACHAAPAAKARKVLLIGIDGCLVDALTAKQTPAIHELARRGLFAASAYVGGEVGTPTEQPTMSAPGWATILTGVWVDKHGIRGNDFKGAKVTPAGAPHFFHRLKSVQPGLRGASLVGWAPINGAIVAPVKQDFALLFAGDGSGDIHERGDAVVQTRLRERLAAEDDDFVFVHYDQVDGAGHRYGFSDKIPEYRKALAQVDAYVAENLQTLAARRSYAHEEWLVALVTDHGGQGTNHGSQAAVVRASFLILSGPGVPAKKLRRPVPMTVVAPTVADWFGVPPKPEWGWAQKSALR